MHELTILSSGSVSAPVDAGTLAYTAGSLSGTLDSTDIKIYKYRLIGTVTLSGASSISILGLDLQLRMSLTSFIMKLL